MKDGKGDRMEDFCFVKAETTFPRINRDPFRFRPAKPGPNNEVETEMDGFVANLHTVRFVGVLLRLFGNQ